MHEERQGCAVTPPPFLRDAATMRETCAKRYFNRTGSRSDGGNSPQRQLVLSGFPVFADAQKKSAADHRRAKMSSSQARSGAPPRIGAHHRPGNFAQRALASCTREGVEAVAMRASMRVRMSAFTAARQS
ncbi:hypothetical protein NRB_19310 [Novosphingobium sp. 11B]